MLGLLRNAFDAALFFHYTLHAGLTGDRAKEGTYVGHFAESTDSLCSPVENSRQALSTCHRR